MVYGLWFMVYGLWFMVYGLWFMVLWFMVYGLWFMVYGLWFMVYGSSYGSDFNRLQLTSTAVQPPTLDETLTSKRACATEVPFRCWHPTAL
jgi:hypothetical protein